jgi:hypothetical protein
MKSPSYTLEVWSSLFPEQNSLVSVTQSRETRWKYPVLPILGSYRKQVEVQTDLIFDECSHARCVHSAIAVLLR